MPSPRRAIARTAVGLKVLGDEFDEYVRHRHKGDDRRINFDDEKNFGELLEAPRAKITVDESTHFIDCRQYSGPGKCENKTTRHWGHHPAITAGLLRQKKTEIRKNPFEKDSTSKKAR